ncbi:MAG: hypothetical protein LC793_13145 [Thermomicrobia bacterium]|nr:hypothetical protein [Thermomicrobia bacterium]MCA1723326.1 hypothetical protein [Thermomicrobia bacterium]
MTTRATSDTRRASCRAWHRRNAAYRRAYLRAWRAANPVKVLRQVERATAKKGAT